MTLLLFFGVLLTAICISVGMPSTQSCLNPVSNCKKSTNYFPKRIQLKFITGQVTELRYSNNFVDLTLKQNGSTGKWRYRIVKCGCAPGNANGRQIVFTNPKSVFVEGGPTLGLFQGVLPSLRPLKFVSGVSNIFSPAVRNRVKQGKSKDIRKPDFSLDFSMLRKDNSLGASFIGPFSVNSFQAASLGKPYVVILEVSEASPLARTEWIKIIGLILDVPEDATKKFNNIVKRYQNIKKRASKAVRRPSLFFNSPFQTSWAQPSEKQFTTSFARDANADYQFAKDGRSSTVFLNFKGVLDNFRSARYLINAGSFPSSRTTKLSDFVSKKVLTPPGQLSYKALVTRLDSVRCGNVWSNQKRVSANGFASDYFERAAFRPDLLLADFVSLLHPELGLSSSAYTYSYGPSSKVPMLGMCPYTVLDGKAPNGKVYVDKYFVVTGLTRFRIEDLLEKKVLPKVSSVTGVGRNSLDIYFTNAQTQKDVSLTVRFSVQRNKGGISSDRVANALKETINKPVKEITKKEYIRRLNARRQIQMK